MENEHPHRFIEHLRPIEEFRNTPLIPISDRAMRDHKEMLERYHRSGFMFEIKKEALINYCKFNIINSCFINFCYDCILYVLNCS